jgi:hypothetical protein
VQQALNRHSQIVIPPETKYFFSFLGHSRQCQHRHIDRLNADLRIHLPKPAARVNAGNEAGAFFDQIARLYLERLGKTNVTYFGEKSPEHTGSLPRIRRQFPDAKFLVLYRDGRDVAASLTHVPWMSDDLYVNFVVWLYYNRIVEAARSRAPANTYFLRYENMVTAPEREFRKILDFLSLGYEPAVAQGHGNREGIPEREYAWKARALEKITTERIGTFRRELTTGQIETLERMGANALPALGYPLLSDGKRPLSLRIILSVVFGLSRLVYDLPWHSLVNDLLGHSWFCCSNGKPRPAHVLPYPQPAAAAEPIMPLFEAS